MFEFKLGICKVTKIDEYCQVRGRGFCGEDMGWRMCMLSWG